MLTTDRILMIVRRDSFKTGFLLGLILLLGAALRFTGLTYQSLWLDEIMTMEYAAPSLSLSEVLSYLRPGGDPHPPVFYILIHTWFTVFGHNDFSAKLFTAISGLFVIVAMYFLGAEVGNKNTGLIAALLTSVNYFGIFFSQEARDYILAFLFSSISLLFFIKALKRPGLKSSLYYGFSTLVLLYTHYYGFFILAAQITIIFVFLVVVKFDLSFLKWFCLSGVIILVGYLPWLKTLLSINAITTFWMVKPEPDFFLGFFDDYFGNQHYLTYLFGALMVVYFLGVYFAVEKERVSELIPLTPQVFYFIILFLWIFVADLIPYVRSVLVLPMLGSRYTIVTLPAILIILALAIDRAALNIIKVVILSVVLISSLFSLVILNGYYSTIIKQQWREEIKFISENTEREYPIISDVAWYTNYYFRQFNLSPTFWERKNAVDSLTKYKPEGVWVATAHEIQPVGPGIKQYLDENYKLVKEFSGYQAWAHLYTHPDYTPVLHGAHEVNQDSTYILNSFGHLKSDPIKLAKGDYELIVRAAGSSYRGRYPGFKILVNNSLLQVELSEQARTYMVNFSINQEENTVIDLEYFDDPLLSIGGRNVYIYSVSINKQN